MIKKRYEIWHSQFGLDLTRYGFREILSPDGDLVEEVNWESDIMNYEEAKKMCAKFRLKHRKNVIHTEDFLKLSNNDPDFISKYKSQLFKHIS